MSSLVVDTNALLRFILDDVKDQADKVEKILKKAQDKKIELIVPQIVIFEIEFALSKYYGFSKSEILDKIEAILSDKYLKIQSQTTFKKALALYGRTSLSLVDCSLAAYSMENNAQIFTFDKDLHRLLLDQKKSI